MRIKAYPEITSSGDEIPSVRADSESYTDPSRIRRRKSVYARLPLAYPALSRESGKQKAPRGVLFICLISLGKFGAGEGIRTLDPNLGKVACYLRQARRIPSELP
jgi:hypothetical protein